MNRATAACAVILMTVSAAALAQTASPAPGDRAAEPTPVTRSPAKAATVLSRPDGAGVRQEIADSLRKAGFRNVRIVPQAFIIQAISQTGDPVTMFLSPDSAKVFIAQDADGQDTVATAGDQAGAVPAR